MKDIDCYVACDNGLLKGINVSNNSCANIFGPDGAQAKKDELVDMAWLGNESILLARQSQEISTLSVASTSCTPIMTVLDVAGRMNSVDSVNDESFAVSWDDGTVRGYSVGSGANSEFQINAGSNLCKMRWPNRTQIVTGGRDNPIKVWDPASGVGVKPVFSAKNLKNTWLDLKRGIWETDFVMFPNQRSLASVTRYCEARLYDLKSGQRRPVLEFKFGEYPFTSISLTNSDYEMIAGTADGRLALFDMRAKCGLLRVFKGFAGTVKSVAAHSRQSLVVSGGLDRFVLVHDKDSAKLVHKIYAKSRITSILLNRHDIISNSSFDHRSEMESKVTNGDVANDDELCDDETVWNELKQVDDVTSSSIKKSRKRRVANGKDNSKVSGSPKKQYLDSDVIDEGDDVGSDVTGSDDDNVSHNKDNDDEDSDNDEIDDDDDCSDNQSSDDEIPVKKHSARHKINSRQNEGRKRNNPMKVLKRR